MSVSEIFVELQGFLAAEQDIREEIRKVVQSLEQTAREILTLLQGVHQGAGFQDIPKRCLKAREHFGTVKTHLTSLKTKFPAEQYYRFHEHWRFVLQRLVFLAAFVVYLESETLVTREAVTEILGIEPDREKGFHLDVEDYLSGVLILASELSRLSVNSVTAGDYSRPLHISTFINELDSGFRLLNLKNDSLRKRYDGLKYDVKKVEEVVYDLSIRGFNKDTVAACGENYPATVQKPEAQDVPTRVQRDGVPACRGHAKCFWPLFLITNRFCDGGVSSAELVLREEGATRGAKLVRAVQHLTVCAPRFVYANVHVGVTVYKHLVKFYSTSEGHKHSMTKGARETVPEKLEDDTRA
ncbi:Translin [Manis pentadactyla]|nr:Translin [Manis pentadactyla]